MKYTVNYKLMIGLIVACVAILGGVHVLHGYQAKRSAGSLLERADKAGREGKKKEETDLLKLYLAYRPDATDVLARYAMILTGSSSRDDLTQAMETLERVLARDPNRPEVRRKAASLAMSLGQTEVARSHYEILAQAAGGDADAEEALGQCEEQVRRFPAAVTWLEKSISHDPSRVSAYARLARLLRTQLRKPERADLVMDALQVKDGLIAANPRSARAFLERAFYRRQYQIAGADDDVKRALELAPDDADVLMTAAPMAPHDEAVKLLSRGIEAHPDDPRFYRAIAMAEVGAGKMDRAIDYLKKGLEKRPENLDLRWFLAEFEIDAGRAEEASAEIKSLRAASFPRELLDFLEARLKFLARNWTEAAQMLARIAPTLETRPGTSVLTKRAFLMLARCHQQLGNPELRYAAARRAVAAEVSDPALAASARVELAAALAAQGRYDEAIDEDRLALRMPGAAAGIRVDLARLLVVKNLRLPPAQRRWDEVGRALGELEAAMPKSADLAILRSEILAAQEKLDEAGDRLQKAVNDNPQDVAPRVALATLAERRGRSGEALAILEDARKQLGDRPELLLALIRYWSARPTSSSSQALAKLVMTATNVKDESERRALLIALADGLDRIDEAKTAATIRERLVAEQPDHLGVRLAQFEAAMRANDRTEASRILAEVRRIEGAEGTLWRYGKAQMLIQADRKDDDDKGLAEARALLAEALERRPGWSLATLAAAEVDDRRQEYNGALRGYLRAIEDGNRNPGAVRRAVQLLYRAGRFDQAESVLRQVQQDGPLSTELSHLAADVALQTSGDDRAINLAHAAIAGKPDSAADQTWLGQLLFIAARKAEERGQAKEARARREEAEKALARGAELAPADPLAQTAYIISLAASGRLDDTKAAIRKAEASLKGPEGELTIARCLAAIGQAEEANARFNAILKARPEDVPTLEAASINFIRQGRIRDAEPLLRRLISLQSKTPRQAAWAKRVLALALASNQGGSAKALELLGLDDAGAGTKGDDIPANLTAEDLRARSQVLARQPNRSNRRKAVAIIDKMSARQEAQPSDRFLRAQLLAADGDWKRARAEAQGLLAEDPANPLLLQFLAGTRLPGATPTRPLPGSTPWLASASRGRSSPS